MKIIVKTYLFFLCTAAAIGQGRVQFVVPGGMANVEGNSSATTPFNSTSFRFQQVFDASQFAIPPGSSGRIDSIAFRIDGASTNRVLLYFGGSSVTLSTTQRQVDSLSPVFSENQGPDATTVFNGAISLGDPLEPGADPQPFGETLVTYHRTFYYIPSQGNLLLDVAASGGQAYFPGSIDAHAQVGDSVSWVWSANGNSASGTAETLGLVTRFDITIIPEPNTCLIVAAGLVLLAVFRRR